MTHTLRFLAMALGLLALGACKKTEAPAPALAELKAPDNADSLAWRMYMTEVVKRHMDGVSESPFMYFLPSADSEDFQGLYDRQLENIAAVVSRTVLPGNMLAFGSPDPAKMAELIEAAPPETNWLIVADHGMVPMQPPRPFFSAGHTNGPPGVFVAAGPAIAIKNSALGRGGSRCISATPPKMNSVIERMRMPARIATRSVTAATAALVRAGLG